MKQSEAFIFMKVGAHAGETFEQILVRKNKEFDEAGVVFWGYGGSACHPIQQVQPFVKSWIKETGKGVNLVMQSVVSNADPAVLPATEYSEDGISWKPIPQGVKVTGSRYALILDEIKPTSLVLDIQKASVGIGPSRGRTASDYLKGRIDKACLVSLNDALKHQEEEIAAKHLKAISFEAKLQAPYAVLLRCEQDRISLPNPTDF